MDALRRLAAPDTLLVEFFNCRFLSKTLGAKRGFVPTYAAMLAFYWAYSGFDSRFGVVSLLAGNTPISFWFAYKLFYFFGFLLLYMALFKGSLGRKAFFNIVLLCLNHAIAFTVLPICYWIIYSNPGAPENFINSAQLILVALLQGALLELAVRRFTNLRNEIPRDIAAFSAFVILFATFSVTSLQDYALSLAGRELTLGVAVFCSMFSACGTALIVGALAYMNRKVTQRLVSEQTALQSAHMKGREAAQRQLALFRHDMDNHVRCLAGLLREGRADQALAYVESLSASVARIDGGIRTGNDCADAIINDKCAAAREAGIAFAAELALPQDSALSVDLCCILSNALDNAIEACGRIENGERWITVNAFTRRACIVLEIKNSIQGEIQLAGGRLPSTKRGGAECGLGLESIRYAVERLGGAMELTAEGCFSLSVMLPLGRPPAADKAPSAAIE